MADPTDAAAYARQQFEAAVDARATGLEAALSGLSGMGALKFDDALQTASPAAVRTGVERAHQQR